MRKKLIEMTQLLINEASVSIHDVSLSVFYTKTDNFQNKETIEESLIKLDLSREVLTILLRMEEYNYRDTIQEYLDEQIDIYCEEMKSNDKLKKMCGETRKRIIDFFVSNLYQK